MELRSPSEIMERENRRGSSIERWGKSTGSGYDMDEEPSVEAEQERTDR